MSGLQTQPAINVFDFLVTGDTPNASQTNLPAPEPPTKKMDKYDPALAGSSVSIIETSASLKHDPDYEKHGFSYGSEPIPKTQKRPRPKVEYFTPTPKDLLRDLQAEREQEREKERNGKSKSSDKKRKRHNVEDLDLTSTRRSSQETDTYMSDAGPAPGFHTGLTGGLNRLLSRDDEMIMKGGGDDPPSPIKRSRPSSTYTVEKGRSTSRPATISSAGALTFFPSTALTKFKPRRASSSESRPRKHQRSYHSDAASSSRAIDDDLEKEKHRHKHRRHHHHHHERSRSTSHTRSTSVAGASVKAIEYHRPTLSDVDSEQDDSGSNDFAPHKSKGGQQQSSGQLVRQPQQQDVILHSTVTRSDLFASFITKGPESEQGCSVDKVLKRYHRERAALGGKKGQHTTSAEKVEEERELWKEVRLRRNERGEIVVFF